MKVMHVLNNLNVGGVQVFLCDLASSLQSFGIESEVVCLYQAGPMAERFKEFGIPVREMELGRYVARPDRMFRLVDWCRRSRPDLIFSWMYRAHLVTGVSACLYRRAPLIWGIHYTMDKEHVRRRAYFTARLCAMLSRSIPARIIGCSRSAVQVHHELGFDPDKLTCILNGFDTRKFRPDDRAGSELRRELGLGQDTLLVGMSGRFHPQKDFPTFMRTAGLIVKKLPNVHFVLCGSNVDENNADLKRWGAQAGIAERCHLLGTRGDMPMVQSAWDVAMLTSKFGEALPLVVGEAMSCGVPCVVTDVGDSADLVSETGRVAPTGDPDALSECCIDLLTMSQQSRRELGMKARHRIETSFNMRDVAKAYAEEFRNVTNCWS